MLASSRFRGLLVTAVLLASVGPAPSPLSGQDVWGGIAGGVLDPTGAPLAGVSVTVSGPALQGLRTAVTDARGRFRVDRLPVGTVSVRIRHIGYRTVELTGVPVELGRTGSLGVTRLDVEPVPLDPLRVEAASILLDATSTSLGETLRSDDLVRLPADRDYRSLVELLPQANTSFLGDGVNIAGGTGLENAFFIEGVNVTDPYRSRSSTSLPHNFVRAVEVQRGGYEARYGNALGGIVNVVTRSGGNELEASGFGTWTGEALSARPTVVAGVQARGGFREVDVGASVAGPVVRDRLWFFSAYNPRRVDEDVALAGLPEEPARITQHRFAARLDGRPSPALSLALSVFGDPATERRVQAPSGGVRLLNPDPVLTRHEDGGFAGSLRGVWQPRDGLAVEAFVSRYGGREDIEGATPLGRDEPTLIDRRDLPRIVLSGGSQSDQRIRSARTSAGVSGSFAAGSHGLEGGVEIEESALDVLIREDPGQVVRVADDLYQASFLVQDFTVQSRVLSAFIQDSWALTDRLRLNIGLRWDGQVLTDQEGRTGQRIDDQLQPRVGLVFQPGPPGTQKVFGHYGRFYQHLALHWSTLTLAGFDQRQVFSSVDPRTHPGAADSTRVFSESSQVRGGVPGLRGQHHDEWVVGYERRLGARWMLGVRGVRRSLGESITMAFGPDGTLSGGNPGRGSLAHLPPSTRRYRALEVALDHRGERLLLLSSWVWSRTEGNYAGLYAADAGGLRGGSFGPNNDMLTYFPVQRVNADGPLPNDRTHVVKVAGALEAGWGLTVGTYVTAASGTPLSDFGRVPSGFNTPLFLAPRGSEGRSPTLWDLSFRFTWRAPGYPGARLIADFLHVGNPRAAVRIDQRRFNGARGSPFADYDTVVANQVGERPAFGEPTAYQPPFSVRLGLEIAPGR